MPAPDDDPRRTRTRARVTPLPEPPPGPPVEPLSPELEAVVKRLRWSLLLVPFAFPRWLALRRESPEAAARLRLPAALNVAQSALVTVLLATLIGLLVFRDAIVTALTQWVISSGVVR